jgi:tRNA nucleotidyltransferase (CCA-adding enzyme)
MKVYSEVLKKIKPNKEFESEIDGKIKEFMSRIKVKDAKIILGGSGAKNTWLKNANDADIFVQFNYEKFKEKSSKLSDILEKQLKKKFKKLNKLHGSRDYFQVIEKGFTFEIVPILNVKNSKNILNITDASPLHAIFVKGQINKKKSLADEIRLMKQFCKANNTYGAESYINGFSGYMCELLVIYYGSFDKLIKASCKWKPKVIIDIKKFYKNKNILFEMNKSKTISPLIIVDPIQNSRNASAALSDLQFEKFIKKAKKFVKKPSVKFFEEKKFDVDVVKKKNIVIEVIVKSGKEDVVGAKLLKAFNHIKSELINGDFVFKSDFFSWDKGKFAYFCYEIPKKRDKIKIITGPNIKFNEHIKKFKQKHKKNYIKKKVIYAKETRKILDAKIFIKQLIKDNYVNERVKNVKIL